MHPSGLTHLDASNQPSMVDVGDKAVTRREAVAQSRVSLPTEVLQALNPQGELISPKGPVFQTAIIAGTLAAKRTYELIPFCHPLPLEQIQIQVEINTQQEAVVTCRVRVTHRTGVEMEALTGASVAALTIYDMCKALSPQLVIRETRLLEKSGGKCDFKSPVAQD